MSVYEHPEFRDHERVVFFRDADTELRVIIAIHRSRGGVAGGGTRFKLYARGADAVADVLRLSRAMTYKMVFTGMPFGGAKAVILGDPKRDKTRETLHAYARCVASLGGQYVCAPDVGTTAEDMAVIHEVTPHVTGLPERGGDTAAPTSVGLMAGLRATLHFATGRDDLAGMTVAVQGVGGVGGHLCRALHAAGVRLRIADIDRDAVERLAAETGAEILDPAEILFADADVLAPCALGAVLDDETVPRVRAPIICGGANNQLAATRHAAALKARGILFVPDYVVNAGGTLGGCAQAGLLDEAQLEAALRRIGETTTRILNLAAERDIAPADAAEELAEQTLRAER